MIEISKERYEKLLKYEALEKENKIIELPVAPKQSVWKIEAICHATECLQYSKCKDCSYCELTVVEDYMTAASIVLHEKEFGKTIFLSEEEANHALKSLK